MTGARHSLRSKGERGRLRQVAVDDESLDLGRAVAFKLSWARAGRLSRAGRRSAPLVCRSCVYDVLGLRFPRAAFLWPRCVYGGSWCCRSLAPIRVAFFARGSSYSTSWGRGACAGSARSRCAACAVAFGLLATMIPRSFGSRALWRAPSTGACGLGDYPTPDLSLRESASRSASTKSK